MPEYGPIPWIEDARNIVLILGVVLGSIGLWLAYRRTQTDVRRLDRDSLVKGLELLGKDSPAVRLGGIQALDEAAATAKDLRVLVLKTLSAFVRQATSGENVMALARATNVTRFDVGEPTADDAEALAGEGEAAESPPEDTPRTRENPQVSPAGGLPIDVQEAISGLGRGRWLDRTLGRHWREAMTIDAEKMAPALELGRSRDLNSVHLVGADLQNGWFSGTRFEGAQLPGAKMQGGWFEGCNFAGADLSNANLQGGRFNGKQTDFTTAILAGANVAGSQFRGAKCPNMTATDLDGLDRADFSDAELSQAIFGNVKPTDDEMKLRKEDKPRKREKVNFSRTILTEAKFIGVDLRGARFRSADISKTDFTAADLRNADFTGVENADTAVFNEADLDGAIGLPEQVGAAANPERASTL